MIPVLVLHGPNINLLGEREPDVYGTLSLKEINQNMALFGKNLGMEIHTYQSNVEGELVNALHEARSWARGILFNPAGYTTTSVALRDAILAIRLPVVEVHLSNIYKREEFRQHSIIAPVCVGSISGFGWRSYALALHALVYLMDDQPAEGG